MDIKEIFENKIKIEAKVMSIDSLFYNPERVKNTDFKPSYQRNYVWDDEKASYFIESILLGTEIPPLVYFRNSDKIEVIDGRQRYQTILRYKNNILKLKKGGLQKLGNTGIANKLFKDLDLDLQELFRDTKLRIIEFSFHSRDGINDDIEEIVKKEIFKRYNSGITPLKPHEINNAVYFDDDVNSYFKRKLQNDEIIYRNISNVFHFEKNNIEVILKQIRQLLVQHEIPIKYYSVKKQTIISKFYDGLFANIELSQIEQIYSSFIRKINLVIKVKDKYTKAKNNSYNRLISETLFWGFSILENEEIDYLKYSNNQFITDLVNFIDENIEVFDTYRSSFSQELYSRYSSIALFLEQYFDLNLKIYLDYNLDFKNKNKEILPENEERISFDELRINKPEPSSIAIMDVCRMTERQKFLIRPPYQRNEVINQKKSSSIIESIILGIKLPPIFVYKREDGISEVLDGQQRLLSILAFIEKPYLDENNNIKYSNKNGFSLNLKNQILKDLHGKKFQALNIENQEKIKNFDLWIIEIDYKNNKNFEPIDLFVRLNNKPYPIKDDTFEMWNSYISRDIITSIKSVHSNHSNWFYFRKNNSRMEDENIYTSLAYFQFCWNNYSNSKNNENYYPEEIDIYKVGSKINFRVKSKIEITRVLENLEDKEGFIKAINHLEFDFIKKLKILLSDDATSSNITLSKNLDDIFMIGNARRTQQSFYALWYFLYDIPIQNIINNTIAMRNDLKKLFSDMSNIKDKSTFEKNVINFKDRFKKNASNDNLTKAYLKEIAYINFGLTASKEIQNNTYNSIDYKFLYNLNFTNLKIDNDNLTNISIDEDSTLRNIFDSKSKILLSRIYNYTDRFNLAIVNEKIAFSNQMAGIVVHRPSILQEFVLALLSSKYYYFKYFKNKVTSSNIAQLTLSDINNIEIPIINTHEQLPFRLIIDYIINSEYTSKVNLFYNRVLDAMVYEIFYKEKFENSNIHIAKYITELEDLTNFDYIEKQQKIIAFYELFSNPQHPLGAHLIQIMNISNLKEIESSL
ncbi:DUF262 domain-containing protein [Chryseobacterium gambrini]|uniref:GmrSD restriction endonucleases N-terminal domain-containing protein n=1 Tax=Chryseobacterium gambrini TaxID=373672 RepID=A0A1N7NZB8_9FLAO|nr:DUF262 domain-containing protein [Chryseobacterium gambrini]SIT03559.1 Protein of unknown function DUF262 [Chryseobacterium gambrini]